MINYKIVGVTFLILSVLTIVLPIIFISVAVKSNRGAALCHSTIGYVGVDTAQLLLIAAFF